MKTFMSDWKKAYKKSVSSDSDVVGDKSPPEHQKEGNVVDDGDYSNCLVRIKCDIFGGDEIGVIFGSCRFSQSKSNLGGRITFHKRTPIEFTGVIFKLEELKILFNDNVTDEQMLMVYNAKKTFSSLSVVTEVEENVD